MPLSLKPGVSIQGIRTELLLAVYCTVEICTSLGVPCVLTSVTDGKHSATSLHYSGSAFDVRTRGLSTEKQGALSAQLKKSLGQDFDVILEATHLHVEYQPRHHP